MATDSQAIQRKDPFINLPSRIFLTGGGLQLFSKNPSQLQRFETKRGTIKEALVTDRYNALLVQKLVLNSFVEEIYVQQPQLLGYRTELISTNNLIVYGILYKKLSPSLAEMLFSSPVVKTYNRKRPKYSIVSLDRISKGRVKQLRQQNAELFDKIEQEIKEKIREKVNRQNLSDEDRENRIRSMEKFIAWIDMRIWYLYLIIYQTPLQNELVESFSGMIVTYLGRTQIATHLSNLMMEFVQNAEKAHFERLIVRRKHAPKNMVDSFLRDRENRRMIIDEALKYEQFLDISWNMNPETISLGQQYRIQISISNYGLISEDASGKLSQKMRTNVDGIPLSNFLEEKDDSAVRLGAGLGLLYNSYLEDICRKEGIHYKCNIYPEPEKEKTTVKLEIIF